ncbi:MAG: bacitracin transporter permease [Bacillales bacterium]|jgi:undecaprenyl-diphosphatase|nr:bacitracin transporter permease [Bacillales bacterium]
MNPFASFIAENTIYLLFIFIILFLFKSKKDRLMILCGTISLIIAEILAKIVGNLHSNNQPFSELSNVNKLIDVTVNNSFPSDHTIIFFSYCVIFWLFKKKLGLLWVLLASIVGFFRIWVGVHYPADILVGALLGFISALIVFLITSVKFKVYNNKHFDVDIN